MMKNMGVSLEKAMDTLEITGKERDAESGYNYYGARYQIVPLGIWGIISRPFVGQNHGDRTNDTLNQTKYPRP